MKSNKKRWLSMLLIVSMFLSTIALIPVHAADIKNVAIFGNGYADTSYPNAPAWSPESLNDGNESTIWIAGNTTVPTKCGVRLDNVYDVQSVKAVFETRNSTAEIMKFTAEYKDVETGKYVQFWQGQNYNEETGKFISEFNFEAPVKTNDIRFTITDRINTQAWPAMMEIYVMAEDIYEADHVELENVALNKEVEVSAGSPASAINDGNKSNFWDGGVAPSEFQIDLGTGYFISSMKALTYYGDGRYYHYEIYASLDGRDFKKVAEKSNNNAATSSGETYEFDEPLNIRYIRVVMTYNSNNPSVHMKEFEAYGVVDSNYKEPEAPTTDIKDPNNIAFNKPARSHLSMEKVMNVTDGLDSSYWTGQFYPAYVDVDLMEEYDLSKIILNLPVRDGRYYYYTVYGSNDYVNFDRLYQKRTNEVATDDGDIIELANKQYRFVRVYLEYCSDAGNAQISEIRVHGTPSGKNTAELRKGSIDEILSLKDFNDTEYATEISEAETIENVYGIIDRTVGEYYRSWFAFKLMENSENDNDYYELSNQDGKILITGNDGISLASGLNYYYKNYCHVNVSEQANQTKMPSKIVPVENTRKETPYKVRYAMNYCTLDYTFAFFGADDFQKENDWLALNGVNVVLDLAGQEAVWIKFLMNFGYSFDEAKDWLAGPSYYAWQFMDNLEIFGGPVSDGWVRDRLNMARENQRWKRSLGMETVLQGYAGMIPTNFDQYQDVDILKQGGWCGLNRPDMIRTDGSLYDEYADLFYEAQRWALGETSNYYAVDPFHEGGIRPSDLSDATIAAEVLESLLKYDQDAVWMVQAWWSNPTNDLLKGMGEYRQDHVMVLDLTGLEAPKWDKTEYGNTKLDAPEFDGTDWVWCMLENYGGNPSMDGQLAKIATDIPNAYKNAKHMKGIGIISEATYDNPVIYDLIFDMAWEKEPIDINEWLDDYVVRRYGVESESAREAWKLLERTIYHRSGNSPYVLARLPENVGKQSLPYNNQTVERAFELLIKDYALLSASEGYRYDVTELMRQVVNNYALRKYNEVIDAFNAKDLEKFRIKKAEFLNAFDVCDLVQGTQKEQLVGEWIGKAEDWAANYDDFSYDSLTMNAKALITSWAGAASASALPDYAYRNYQGMMIDLYKSRWQTYLDKEEQYLMDGTPVNKLNQGNYFHFYWNWVMNTPEYTREANNSVPHMKEVIERVKNETLLNEKLPENEGNLALDKDIFASKEVNGPGSNGGYVTYANDGSTDTYWEGGPWEFEPWLCVDLKNVYSLDRINVLNYPSGSRYYLYDIYVSNDNENWTKVVTNESTSPAKTSGEDYVFENGINARYIKLVGKYNSANESFHVKEIRAYGENYFAKLNTKLDEVTALDVTNKSPETLAVFNETVAKAADMLEKQVATRDEITAMINELQVAVDNLVELVTDKTALQIAVEVAQNADLTNIIPIVVAEFNSALAEAKVVLAYEHATQTTIDLAFMRLANAMHMLEFVKGNKQDLINLIEQIAQLTKDDYTTNSWAKVEKALDVANSVIENENAMQAEVNDAYNNLLDAFTNLQRRANKDALQQLVDKVTVLDANKYLETTWQAMLPVLANAKAVLDNIDAIQSDVDSTYDALVRAYLNLRLKPNKDLLNDLINKAEALDAKAYTTKSYVVLTNALVEAKAVLNNPNTSDVAVKTAIENLEAGIAGLVVNGDKAPGVATGDNNIAISMISLATLSLAGLWISRRKEN